MQLTKSKMPTLATLLPALERAAAGDARLDLLIAYLVDAATADDLRRIGLFRDEHYTTERIETLLGFVPLPYTTSLDAALPGENIVLSMYSATRRRWAAIHRRSCGSEDLHWGTTEPLARRIAALHALGETHGDTGCDESRAASETRLVSQIAATLTTSPDATRDATTVTDEGAAAPWKILF